MKKIFGFILVAVLMFASGCEFHDHHGYHPIPDDHWSRGADYCDNYPAGTCCGWYAYSTSHSDCYEEWCTWGYGWEYDGEYCYQ